MPFPVWYGERRIASIVDSPLMRRCEHQGARSMPKTWLESIVGYIPPHGRLSERGAWLTDASSPRRTGAV